MELAQQGEPIAGLFMQNWADDGSGDCRAEDDRRDAVAVCGVLGMPFHFRDFSGEYWSGVFEHFLAEYAAGRTPNPDVLCNREVKFKHFLDAAQALGAERIATGHYAQVAHRGRRWRLLRGADRDKDQSYFLHQLGQSQLAATLFPIGDLEKARCVESPGMPACRPTPRRIPPASASSASAISANFWAATCRAHRRDPRPAGAAHRRASWGVLLHPGSARGAEHRRRARACCRAVVRGWQGCGEQCAVRGPGPRQPIAAIALAAVRTSPLGDRCAAGTPLQLHCADPLPPARRALHGRRAGRWQRAGALRTASTGGDAGQSLVLYDGKECLGGAVIAATDAPLERQLAGSSFSSEVVA